MASVSLKKLSKNYDGLPIVRSIDLEIADQEFIVLVGPSGCGKSTTLRMIAGLEDVSDGEIMIAGRTVNEVAPRDRDIAMVFQSYALYPHMTVEQNMSFGLRLQGVDPPTIGNRVEAAAGMLGLGPLLRRLPKAMSGGQRQRVAMGRALVRKPVVFLFDEPLSNLDAALRLQVRMEIKKLHQSLKTTTVYVTHDQVEAMTLADRVVVMNGGNIEQVGTPQDLYHRPKTKFVAGFIGSPPMNFIAAQLEGKADALSVSLPGGRLLPIPCELRARYRNRLDRAVTFGMRPEHFAIARDPAAESSISVIIDVVEPMGADTLVYFAIGTTTVCARLPPDVPIKVGQGMLLDIDMHKIHLIDPDTGLVL